ncbi:serine hydrolase, partial [Limosilactobacillus reuteri]
MQRSQRHRRKPRRLILIIIAILLIIMGVRHFSSTSARLKSAWNKIIFTSNNNVSIAVYSPKTHQIYTSSNAPQHKFRTASTVKVSILAGILAKQQSPLTSHQKSLATKMIEQSDNDSTSELFEDYLGGKNGLQQTFEKFGMTQSKANSSWGLTVTTPKDQVKLLNNIFYKSKVLS